MCDIAELVGITPAEVLGTVSFYEMFHTEPIGRYLISVCTNISCMLGGAYDLLDHIKKRLKVSPDGTTSDGLFTLQEAECLAGCDKGPCVTVNHRYVDANTSDTFDALVEQLKAGSLEDAIPVHGVLIRVKRERGREAVKDDGVEVAT
jgi:NADH:ubiquinone oxidoreductase subunit E